MNKNKKNIKSSIKVNDGIEQPSQINDKLIKKLREQKNNSEININDLFKGIKKGNRVSLGKAITLIESNHESHQENARKLIEKCLPYSGKSIRLGITGVPGVGKSTFIEALGMHLIKDGHKVCVLAIDPSSERTKGSILGDKTRMELLSAEKDAFIRPSPSAGTLGGVARKTRETILLCETAGYNIVFVETVGVGQSEVAMKTMVDFFLLLVLTGAGDDLQGIKRGIMEMADSIFINKADGDNLAKAKSAISLYKDALHYFPASDSKWTPQVLECSSSTGYNIPEAWNIIKEYVDFTKQNGYFTKNRNEQEIKSLHYFIDDYLRYSFYSKPEVKNSLSEIEALVKDNKISPFHAAKELIEKHRKI